MKKTLFLIILSGFMILNSGCAGEHLQQDTAVYHMKTLTEIAGESGHLNCTFDNLDFSDVTISVPDVDEISTVVFPVSTDSLEEQTAKFEYDIRQMENLDEGADLTPYMNIMYWDYDLNDRVVVPYEESTDEQLDMIQYLSYNDGVCSALVVFSDFMLEIGNYSLPLDLTGDNADYTDNAYGYRAIDLGTPVETFHLPADDISNVTYRLADGEMPLREAVSYTEQHIKKDYYFVGSDLLDYYVSEVQVRQLQENVYYYQFRIQASYQGVRLNKDGGVELGTDDEETDPLANTVFGTEHKASMFQKNSLDFIWSSCHSYEAAEIQETYKEFISPEDACELLSQEISGKNTFRVDVIELLYQTEFQYESEEKREYGYIQSVYCHPVWHFTIKNPGISGYENIYFDVDALTGEIITMVS